MNCDTHVVRKLQSSLTLLGALVYFINCLHSRPDDGSYARKLARVIFPLTPDANSPNLLFNSRDDPDGRGLPYAIGGVMYLRDILLKPTGTTYRFSEIALLDEDVFRYAIGCLPEDVTAILFKVTIQRHDHLAGYIPQRKGVTKRRAPRREEVELDRQFPELQGIVEEVLAETAEGCAAPPEEVRIGDVLEKILQQYASDIMQKCGNLRGQGPVSSFCPLVQYERQHLNFDDINTLDLGHLFTQVQWRQGTPDDWDRAFDRLFPDVNHIDHFHTSHFGTCRYYRTYREWLQKLPKDRGLEVRAALEEKIAELAWIPATKSDRLWDYSMGDESWIKVPNPTARGPKILVNLRVPGRVHLANKDADEEAEILENLEEETRRRRHFALREEEEEDSSDDGPQVLLNRNRHRAGVASRPVYSRTSHNARARSHSKRTSGSHLGRSNRNTTAAWSHSKVAGPSRASSRTTITPNSNCTLRGNRNASAGPSQARSHAPAPPQNLLLDDENSDGWSPPPVHQAFDP